MEIIAFPNLCFIKIILFQKIHTIKFILLVYSSEFKQKHIQFNYKEHKVPIIKKSLVPTLDIYWIFCLIASPFPEITQMKYNSN